MTEALRFKVADLVDEVIVMERLARKFLAAEAGEILPKVKEQFETLFHQTHKTTIAVDAGWPIRTKPCNGGYERDEGGTRKDLFAELVFKWELCPLGTATGKGQRHRQVEIAGIASSVVRLKIIRDESDVTIASWRMEFGDSASPGAFFHAQIPDTMESAGSDQCPPELNMWPPWLPIPRLPILPITPMLALEFTLGELFRDGWRTHLASGGHDVSHWRSLQTKRLVNYFEWQKKNAQTSGPGSPLLGVIDAKPKYNLFLHDA